MLKTLRRSLFLLLPCLLAGCAASAPPGGSSQTAPEDASSMNSIAESYVKLALAVGPHDPDYIDAYYGPPEWRSAAEASKRPLADIRSEAGALISRLESLKPAASDDREGEMVRLRHEYLLRQLSSLAARVDILSGKKMSFDEESKALYDAVAPKHDDAYFQSIIDRLAAALPGDGLLTDRYDAFRKQFEIPPGRLDAVFQAALVECRKRTSEHIPFPPGEDFEIEYVSGKPWAGYNWYKGKYQSLIQVNTGLPIYIDRAVDLACHEGYPGHHLYNSLLEKNLVQDRGWVETSIYPLFSPQSFIAEGTANYGIEVAFPEDERIAFESKVLFPIAGIDPGMADRYYEIQRLLRGLGYAANEAARMYLDGKADREATIQWLIRYALNNPQRADQQIRFIEQYRSYVINYNLGRDIVREYIERGNPSRGERWDRFEELISSPRLPSGLK